MKRNEALVNSSLFTGIKKNKWQNLLSSKNFDDGDTQCLTRQAEYNSNLVRQVCISFLNINWHNTVNLIYSILEKVFSYKVISMGLKKQFKI